MQAALDAAFLAGGGTVYLAPGRYCVGSPLILRSRVYLIGAGIGATVLLGKAGAYTGTVVNGAEIYATLAAVAAENVSIRDLTVDHATNGTIANGIALLPDGVNYGGTPSSGCAVEGVQVLGSGNYHTYQIWNLRGLHNKIINSWVDGGVSAYTPGSSQEGIESYGGVDILIAGNSIRNIGNAALNLGSAGLANSGLTGVIAIGNYIEDSAIGIAVFPSFTSSTGPQQTASVQLKSNVIMNTWKAAIYATATENTVLRDLQIVGNTVRGVGDAGNQGWAIFLNGSPAVATTSTAAIATVVRDNVIEDVNGTNSYGVLIVQYPNVQVLGNTITRVGHSGVYAYAAHDATMSGNRIADAARIGILVSGSSRRVGISGNLIWQWARLSPASGISINTATDVVIQGNEFFFENSVVVEPSAVRVEAGSARVRIANNSLLFAPRMGFPFVNRGLDPSRGTFSATAGLRVITINNALATPAARVTVTQTSGSPAAFTVSTALGYFVVTLASPSQQGTESFIYEVFP